MKHDPCRDGNQGTPLGDSHLWPEKKKRSVARKGSVHTFPDILKNRFHIQYCLGDMVLTHEWQSRNGQREV